MEERHEFTVKFNEGDEEEFYIGLRIVKSNSPTRGIEFLKDMSMSSHPRLVATLLKMFFDDVLSEGLLFGLIEVISVGINRNVLREDLKKLSDRELGNRLYELLPSDHLLNKINNGGWVDEEGNMHEYP